MACNCKDKRKCTCKEPRVYALPQTTIGIKDIINMPESDGFKIILTNDAEYFVTLPKGKDGLNGTNGTNGLDGTNGNDGNDGVIDLDQINELLDGQLEDLSNAISQIANDGILVKSEKLNLKVEVNKIKSEYPSLISQAISNGLEELGEDYTQAYNDLILYIDPILLEEDSSMIDPVEFIDNFKNYYTTRAAILLAVSTVLKADAAQAVETAEGVQSIHNFWQVTIDEAHGIIAAGTLLVGTSNQNNAGITGVTEEGGDSVRIFAGGTYLERASARVQIRDNGGFWLGTSQYGLDWDITNPNTLTIRGALVQDTGGNTAEIVLYRGAYNPAITYYKGNTVTYNGSSFFYKNDLPQSGVTPVEGDVWTVYVAKGEQGTPGLNGTNGAPGAPGADGQTPYFHVAYANSADGTVGFNQSSGSYIGTYVDYNVLDSNNPSSYNWVLVKGADGQNGTNGIAGTNGANGQTSYLHIKYSNDGGATLTGNSGEDVGSYIGQYVDFTLADSTNPAMYTWALIKGADGANGTPGAPGADGKYTEFRFAKNGSPTSAPALTNSSDSPSGWTVTQPALDSLEYLWMISAVKNANGTLAGVLWSSPVRQKAVDGTNGTNGAAGPAGPFLAGRGNYDATKTYVGSPTRIEGVFYNGTPYVTRVDAGGNIPPGTLPTDVNYWNTYGGTFESVATDLFFAQVAYINNLGVGTLRTGTAGQRITINEDNDNQFKAYHVNGNIGIRIGTSPQGLAVIDAYNDNGELVWTLGKEGISFVTVVPESWSIIGLITTGYYGDTLTESQKSAIANNIKNGTWSYINVNDGMRYISPAFYGHTYEAGDNPDSLQNEQYEGWHYNESVKSTSNWVPDGWTVIAHDGPIGGPNEFSYTVSVVKFLNGQIIDSDHATG